MNFDDDDDVMTIDDVCVSVKVRLVRWCLCSPASQLRSTARSTLSSRSRRCSGSLQTVIACPSPMERAGVCHCSLYRWFFDDHLTNDNDKRTTLEALRLCAI